MNTTETLLEFTEMIKDGIDFTFVKLGDGEMISMIGNGEANGGKNIDGSHYTESLSDSLVWSYRNLLREGVYLGNMFAQGSTNQGFVEESYKLMFEDYKTRLLPIIPELEGYNSRIVPGNFLLHQIGNLTPELKGFYSAIRNSNRRKVYIGPKRLEQVASLLKAEFVEVPEVDAFLKVEEICDLNLKDSIVLVSAGMAAKVFSYNTNAGTKIDLGSAFDPLVKQSRTSQVTTEEIREFYKDWMPTNIPKHIYTIWLSENEEIPEVIAQCIISQSIPGYEHTLITLDNCWKGSQYVLDALKAKKWVKAVDFLRMHYLYNYGGIFLDADVEMLPGKNFDHLLNNRMFGAREKNGFIGAAVLGAERGYPFIKDWIQEVEENFKGDDDKNFESSMDILVRGYFEKDWCKDGFALVPTESFYPYDHQAETTTITPDTVCKHLFLKSWVLPTVSFIIPQLGRPEGLQRCLNSIKALNYLPGLIDIKIIEGPETVPVKVKKGVEETKGDFVVFAANDVEFTPDSLMIAVKTGKPFVAFNTGEISYDEGNVNEHFMIKRDLIPLLENSEVFSTDFNHVGCDNFLWAQLTDLGYNYREQKAIVHHYHFSKGTNIPYDEVYAKGWALAEKDRETLRLKLKDLHERKTH